MTKVDSTLDKLEESEDKYKKLIESLPHGLSIIQHNEIVFVNKLTLKMFGYDNYDEIIGKLASKPLFKGEENKLYVKGEKLLNDEIQGPIHYNTLAVKKDGTIFPIEMYITKIYYEGWRALQVITIDISDKVDLEKNYRRILDSFADPINVVDKDLRYLYINEPLREWVNELGYHDDLIGKKLTEVFQFLPKKMEEEYKKVFQTGEVVVTHDYSQVGDKRIYTETRKIPIMENNQVSQVLTIVRDFTARELYEKKLRESEEKYRSLFENAPYSIFLIDMQGKILDCNQATIDLFGYSKGEIIGSSHRELKIHPEEKINSFIERFVKLIKGKDVEPIETKLYTKNQNLKWVQIRSSLIQIGGKYLIQTIIQDIEKRKKAERELKGLNKLKSDLLKRTSHELKTPLVSIKGFTNLLVELYRSDFNTEIMSFIDEIKNGCSRLEDLIKDIIKTSELESEKKELVKSKTNLTKLIKSGLEELRGFIRLRKHTIKVDIESNMIINCEKEKIRDVFSNLLTNAIKYTPPNGLIVIESHSDSDSFIISIKDTGIGLTKKEINSIFTQFGKIERYGQGYDVISEGSGLGLYMSKKIIEMHNGKIWVESEGRN
ncbi:MAG: PAS domain S-box protein, partial [Candidatus Lokiarchaeota archaeon]|nr:PAS domain S-box protein [Candidatus Lokiarchaeota archaeon]